MRRLRDRVGADSLGHPGRRSLEEGRRRLGRDVARPEPGSACREDDARPLDDRVQGGCDLVAVVGDDAALDLVPLGGEELREELAARVLALARRDAVRDGEDGRLQAGSFVFSSRRTPPTTISPSTAFAMS